MSSFLIRVFLHRNVSVGNITMQAGAEGFLMDLKFARIRRSSIDITRTLAVLPVRTDGGGMSAPTVTSHTIFGPDVMRGAE